MNVCFVIGDHHHIQYCYTWPTILVGGVLSHYSVCLLVNCACFYISGDIANVIFYKPHCVEMNNEMQLACRITDYLAFVVIMSLLN